MCGPPGPPRRNPEMTSRIASFPAPAIWQFVHPGEIWMNFQCLWALYELYSRIQDVIFALQGILIFGCLLMVCESQRPRCDKLFDGFWWNLYSSQNEDLTKRRFFMASAKWAIIIIMVRRKTASCPEPLLRTVIVTSGSNTVLFGLWYDCSWFKFMNILSIA